MQTMPHTPAHAQHIPDGWSFPTLTAATPPAAQPQLQPVTGGGAAPSTVTRVRWGRVLPLFAGMALVAFGIWNVTNDSPAGSSGKTVSGGGSSEVDISRSVGSEDAGVGDDATGVDSSGGASDTSFGHDATTKPAASPAVTPPAQAVTPAGTNTVRGGGGTNARAGARAGGTRNGRAGRTARRGAVVAPAFAPGSASAATAPRTRAGGGAPTGELPLTGIETWIAGILGVLLLGIGICVHVSAVRIATTAMLYRRGILLRPTEWELLSQQDGLARVRVALSNVLHRLLEEPARGSDFVSARHAI